MQLLMIKMYKKREKTVIGMTSIEEKRAELRFPLRWGGGDVDRPFRIFKISEKFFN